MLHLSSRKACSDKPSQLCSSPSTTARPSASASTPAERADRFEALEPVKQAVRERFGAFAKDVAAGLRLRHDHGSQYVGHHFPAEIRFLGIESSPAFVREPEGNGCAQRFVRTLKENLLWVRRFETVEELRLALIGVQANLQPGLDHRAALLQDARSGPRRSGRPVTHGRVSADRCLTTVDRYTTTLASGRGRTVKFDRLSAYLFSAPPDQLRRTAPGGGEICPLARRW